MSQTSYPSNMPIGLAGTLYDIGDNDVLSRAAVGAIGVGRAVMRHQGKPDTSARLPKKNYETIAFSTDFVTGNSIVATVNGVALSAVVFATDHLTTITALATAIQNTVPVLTATVGGASNRSIFLTGNDVDITVTVATTGGAGQPTATYTYDTADYLLGIAMLSSVEQAMTTGVVDIADLTAVNILNKGRVWVVVEEAVTPASPVFIRHTDNGANTSGGFRASADTARAKEFTRLRYMSSASAGGLAVVEINNP